MREQYGPHQQVPVGLIHVEPGTIFDIPQETASAIRQHKCVEGGTFTIYAHWGRDHTWAGCLFSAKIPAVIHRDYYENRLFSSSIAVEGPTGQAVDHTEWWSDGFWLQTAAKHPKRGTRIEIFESTLRDDGKPKHPSTFLSKTTTYR